jgi:DNA mismatch repair protein MutS
MTNKKGKSLTEEYLEYHEKYVEKFGKDRTLVLMQVGSFYEAYSTVERGPDLKILEELTEASIAHKGCDKSRIDINNPLMWGFPMVASLKFIGILIENGYRLIMIDQTSPKPNIKREVVAIYSPATYLESSYKSASNFVANLYIEEILQKNGTVLACIGMSAIDVSTGEVYVHEAYSQSNDDKLSLDETLRFLNSLLPKEIIIHKENLKKLKDDYLIEYLELNGKFYQFKNVNKEHNKLIYQKKVLEKSYPNRQNMTGIIDTLGLSENMYARIALVNLLIYISDHYENLIKGLADPNFYLQNKYMVLGNDAINQLNVVDNRNVDNRNTSFNDSSLLSLQKTVKYHNLMDVINKADTGMGRRYVKMRLISPYTDPEQLNVIYNTVEQLMKDNFFQGVSDHLRKINDIERLYRKLSLGVLHPMQMVELINSYQIIEKLFQHIKSNNQLAGFIKTADIRKPIRDLNGKLDRYINIEKAKLFNLNDIKENIFKKDIYPDLDKLQESVGDNHVDMEELLNLLDGMITDANPYCGKKIVLKNNKRDGYYYQTTPKRYALLMKSLGDTKQIELEKRTINVCDFEKTETNNLVKLTLPFLKNQTADIDLLIEQITATSHKYYTDFLADIDKEFGDAIKKSIDQITKIDYMTNIAKVSKEYNYVRPKIENKQTDRSYMETDNIRHPIVERIVEHEYVPHSINIGQDLKGMLIYGLNSSGKSVLMKAIGISIIMAQSGFFVPATRFVYYPYKSLYTRITGNDDLFRGLSSFSLEIVELNNILKRSNQSTLVIGDEVCRGTEHISGNAIVATTLLKLSDLGATFVFATHLHELMELEMIRNKKDIKAFHLTVDHDETTDRLVYDRELKEGSGERIYGITVAKYIVKDSEFINKALEIKNILLNLNPDSSAVGTKTSRYNQQLLMDCCECCGKKNTNKGTSLLETHHINHQKDCEDGFVKDKPHIKKNQIFNLMVLCQECHDKIHNQNISIEAIKMTSGGKKVVVKKNNL